MNPGGYIEITEFEVWVRNFEPEYRPVAPTLPIITCGPKTAPPPPPTTGSVVEMKEKEKIKSQAIPTLPKQEADYTYIQKWQEGLKEAANKIGRTFDVAPNLADWLSTAGFDNVTENVTKVPNTPWAKGKMKRVSLAFLAVLVWCWRWRGSKGHRG